MPAGTGRVGGEDGAGPHRLDRLGEATAPSSTHERADALEAEEAGVALVGVEDLGVDAERLEGPHAADAEQDLLADAVLGVAAVEAVGDEPRSSAGSRRRRRRAGRAGRGPTSARQTCATQRLAGRGRPATRTPVAPASSAMACGSRSGKRSCCQPSAVELLAEVAVAVEEADADERHAEVAGRLEVVAGQHAEAARVLRERLGDAELGGEVGDDALDGVVRGLGRSGTTGGRPGTRPASSRPRRVARNAGSVASASSRAGPTCASSCPGSWLPSSQARGRPTEQVPGRSSHDQRRLIASCSSARSGSGRRGRTVKLRSAFIPVEGSAAPLGSDRAASGFTSCSRR